MAGLTAVILGAAFAQTQAPIPVGPPKTVPGKPPQMALPMTPPPTSEAKEVTVPPGPDPWYTTFCTGEVVGYIEPCG